MTNMKINGGPSDKMMVHPGFAERMAMAADNSTEVPPPNYGRQTWIAEQFQSRHGRKIAVETVRKWFVGNLAAVSLTSMLMLGGNPASAADVYMIEFAANDEHFGINGEVFEAQVYCLGWESGQRVIFLEGSPFGACASAELFNLDREESCSVWCE